MLKTYTIPSSLFYFPFLGFCFSFSFSLQCFCLGFTYFANSSISPSLKSYSSWSFHRFLSLIYLICLTLQFQHQHILFVLFHAYVYLPLILYLTSSHFSFFSSFISYLHLRSYSLINCSISLFLSHSPVFILMFRLYFFAFPVHFLRTLFFDFLSSYDASI